MPAEASKSNHWEYDALLMNSTDNSKTETDGYRAIFKSSSMLGGSQGVSYLIGFVRTKALAYLLGPAGIGLLGLYSSITSTVGTFSAMGIGESAVREIASAHGSGDFEKLGRVATVIRRACFISGLFGLILSAVLAVPLSVQSFGNSGHAMAIAILGTTLLAGSICSGQNALLQGTGRIAEVAKMNIASSVVGILPVILIYAWWKNDGIIPALLLSSLLSLLVSFYYSRSVAVGACKVTWRETLVGTKSLLTLGFAFMLTGLLWAGKDMVVRSMITRFHGLDSAGIYQSAWAISGLFVNFVLRAMGTDFYPRLTAMQDDHSSMVKAVNQQIEIGVLLALPGVIATISCAPMVILILYSSKFHGAPDLLAVLSCGVFFKVVSYPLNTVQLAKGDARGFATFGVSFALLEIGLTIALLMKFGVIGAAVAYPISCLAHVFAMVWVGRNAIDFRFNSESVQLLLIALLLIIVGLLTAYFFHGFVALGIGMVLSLVSAIYCMRGLARRLGRAHRIVKIALGLPGARFFIS